MIWERVEGTIDGVLWPQKKGDRVATLVIREGGVFSVDAEMLLEEIDRAYGSDDYHGKRIEILTDSNIRVGVMRSFKLL